jgi:uncharacterized protein YlaI
MRVKCVICDVIESIEDESPLAKRLRNRPIHTYMCEPCNSRIADKTNVRTETGKYSEFKGESREEEW